jgi:hypothetical protein
MADQQVVAMSLQQINRKEVGAARVPGTSIVRHVRSIVGYLTYGAMPYSYCSLRGLMRRWGRWIGVELSSMELP